MENLKKLVSILINAGYEIKFEDLLPTRGWLSNGNNGDFRDREVILNESLSFIVVYKNDTPINVVKYLEHKVSELNELQDIIAKKVSTKELVELEIFVKGFNSSSFAIGSEALKNSLKINESENN